MLKRGFWIWGEASLSGPQKPCTRSALQGIRIWLFAGRRVSAIGFVLARDGQESGAYWYTAVTRRIGEAGQTGSHGMSCGPWFWSARAASAAPHMSGTNIARYLSFRRKVFPLYIIAPALRKSRLARTPRRKNRPPAR